MVRKEIISLPDIVGKGYKAFWNYKGRYKVCKGSRASKKSKPMVCSLLRSLSQNCLPREEWSSRRTLYQLTEYQWANFLRP